MSLHSLQIFRQFIPIKDKETGEEKRVPVLRRRLTVMNDNVPLFPPVFTLQLKQPGKNKLIELFTLVKKGKLTAQQAEAELERLTYASFVKTEQQPGEVLLRRVNRMGDEGRVSKTYFIKKLKPERTVQKREKLSMPELRKLLRWLFPGGADAIIYTGFTAGIPSADTTEQQE